MSRQKTIYTVNVNNYAPEITALTYPLLEAWASRIDADICLITERRWPKYPIVYEKLQIFDLANDRGDEWSIYVDSDTLIHPECIDFTDFLPRDTIMHNGMDIAPIRWRYDKYFKRDGRNLGSCNWFAVAHEWCRDLWQPLQDLTLEQAVDNIYPTVGELQCAAGITPEHLIDDYTLSRNIARYGLKATTMLRLLEPLGLQNSWFLWHQYTYSIEDKVKLMKEVLEDPKKWNIGLPKLDSQEAEPEEEESKDILLLDSKIERELSLVE